VLVFYDFEKKIKTNKLIGNILPTSSAKSVTFCSHHVFIPMLALKAI
jgi:hypothetical protein